MGSASEAAQRGISAETILTFVTGAVLGYAVRAIGWAGSKVGSSRLPHWLCNWVPKPLAPQQQFQKQSTSLSMFD
jgi:hypothetical protein